MLQLIGAVHIAAPAVGEAEHGVGAPVAPIGTTTGGHQVHAAPTVMLAPDFDVFRDVNLIPVRPGRLANVA